MDEAEALIDVATGGVIANAVEPKAGERTASDAAGHAARCLNCGTALTGDYCHACGQSAHVHRTLSAFWHDLLHGVLHFEGKIWRTLPMLAWRPGELTRRYVAGERARFVSPLALFLFCVFTMFAVIGWTGGPVDLTEGGRTTFSQGIADDVAKVERKAKRLEAERVAAIAARAPTAAIDERLREARDEASLLRLMQERGITEATMVRASDNLPEQLNWLEDAYRKAKANPSLLLYKLQNNAYKSSWALIPISVPFVWLLFPFSRQFRMYDHAVFVTYSLCFMTLLFVVMSLLRAAGAPGGIMAVGFTFVPAVHMFRQLRGAYGLRRWSALWRTALLLVVCVITLVLFMLMLVALGVLG